MKIKLRTFKQTLHYIFIGPGQDYNPSDYDDGCTGIPELDNPRGR